MRPFRRFTDRFKTENADGEALLATRTDVWAALCLGLLAAATLLALNPLAALAGLYLVFTMGLITLIDRRHFIIPDLLSLPAIPLGLAANLPFHPAEEWSAVLIEGLGAAAIGAGVLLAVRAVYERYRGIEGLGLGDVKLAAVAGAWVGLDGLAATSLIACFAALAAISLRSIRNGFAAPDPREAIPFGSFIAPAIALTWIWHVITLQ